MDKKVYCAKCDLYYWTPKGDKAMEDCPFCSLGNIPHDNLSYADKKRIKNNNY